MARLKKKILIFGYDFPNITFDAVVHFTNIFYILIAFPSRYSEHVLIQLINLPRNRDPIVTFRTCFVSRKRTGWKKACYRSDRAAAEFVDCVGRAMKEDFVKDILNARYYSILTDGSTDASILELEVMFYSCFPAEFQYLNTHTLMVWINASKIVFNALKLPKLKPIHKHWKGQSS